MRGLALVALLASCKPAPSAGGIGGAAPTTAGMAVAIYALGDEGYALVEDRRELVVTSDRQLILGDLAPSIDLRSLVLDGSGLAIGACHRAAIIHDTPPSPSSDVPTHEQIVEDERGESMIEGGSRVAELDAIPTITCDVTAGAPGKHLVRAVYTTTSIAYRARTELTLTVDDKGDGRAAIATRFAITTPPGHRGRASVVVYDGRPGMARAPVEVARGAIELDGSTAILPGATVEVGAHLRRIYEGAVIEPDVPSNDARWGRESNTTVRVHLELDGELPIGEIFAHVTEPGSPVRDLAISSSARRLVRRDAPHRLALWTDPDLRAGRERGTDARSRTITDKIAISIMNRSETARTVWIEERIRAEPKQHTVTTWWPKARAKPELDTRYARTSIVVPPNEIARLGFTIDYR